MSETSMSTNGSSRIISGALMAWMSRSVGFSAFWMRRIWRGKTPFWCAVRIGAFSPENTAGLKNDGCMRKVSSLPFWSLAGVIEPGNSSRTWSRTSIWLPPFFDRRTRCTQSPARDGSAAAFSESGPKEWREEVLYQYFDGGTLQKPGSLQYAQARASEPQVQTHFLLRIRYLEFYDLLRSQRVEQLNWRSLR